MGTQEKSAVNSSTMQRVKIYCLNEDGKWDDQGTGLVTVDYLERASEDLALFVIDADENETLLMHRIRSEDIYRKQDDSIISWRDPDYATELALSFQEPAGCSYIWEHLSNVQRNLHFSTLKNDTFHSVNSDLRELPAVELSTLPLIHKMFMDSGIADQMRLIELVLHDDFLRKLVEVFKICEDLDSTEGLHMIFRIVKGIILLNSPQIFEKIFGDELIMDIIGSLEYDPEVSQVQHHRDFLKEHVVFKEAIPIKDPTALSRIHQTYRVCYLKDVILARVLDDATTSNLNSIIHGNNAVVVSLLKDDNTFIQELFARLQSPTTSSESKKNLVYFLHDFCNLSKSLQMVQQLRLFRDLMNEGIFDIIKEALQSDDIRLVLTGTDILILFLNQDPNLLRSYVVRQEGVSLLQLLVKGMITDFGDDMHCQFLEILRNLLDSHTLTGGQRDNIVEIFYEKHLAQLIDVIVASCLPRKSADSARARSQKNTKPEILSSICELLCFCAVHHPYRTKSNLLHNSFIEKVLLLTHRREKYLVVAAVRFFRTILTRHDEQLISHIVKNNLFKPVVDAFVKNGDRYNLLNSAVLDLFEHIRKDNNLKLLVKYIVGSFWKDLVKFEHLDSVQSLKIKFEQSRENPVPRNAVTFSDTRRRAEERALEKEEYYFNEDSDEEDSVARTQKVQALPVLSNGVAVEGSPSLSPRSGGLVDYKDDDDDDEEFKTPPKNEPEVIENDEKTTEAIELKRKLSSKDDDQELVKKQRLCKSPKSKEFFAVLCSTLGKIPENAATTTTATTSDQNHQANSDGESRIRGDEIQSVTSNSTADMAVNGS